MWRNGRAFTRDPKGRGFESWPVRFQVTGQATHMHVPLEPSRSSIIWYRPMGDDAVGWEDTAGLVESNGWRKVTCWLTTCTPGSVPGSTLGNEYGRSIFYLLHM